MIFSVGSRDNNGGVVLFGRGRAEWGLLDAGLAGTAEIRVAAGASGMTGDVVKEGSLVHVFPQHGFGHWYGLILDPPRYDVQSDTFAISALEVHGFLGDIDNVDEFTSQYLDITYVAWRAFRNGIWGGWGIAVSDTPPATSGHAPKNAGLRGMTLSQIAREIGESGRANGVRVTPTDEGYVEIEVGLPQLDHYQGALIAPFNVREENAQSAGRSVAAVIAEGAGDFAIARDAGARFPGRQLVSSSGDLGRAAGQRLRNLSTPAMTLNFRASVDALSDLRVGDVAPYIRANHSNAPAMYLRIVSIQMDESLLPTEFGLTAQVYESDATSAGNLSLGPRQPGWRGTGNAIVRRARER